MNFGLTLIEKYRDAQEYKNEMLKNTTVSDLNTPYFCDENRLEFFDEIINYYLKEALAEVS